MKKLFVMMISLALVSVTLVGCLKRDVMEGINIITSSYSIEYLVNELYGEHANIENIFPDGQYIEKYAFNDKQYNNFSKEKLFVYNGKNASDIAVKLVNRNNDLLLIDSTLGMKANYGIEEFWLDPSNLLMMAKNIKNGLDEYITNNSLSDEIGRNYEKLTETLSELDAEFRVTVQNANSDTIVVTNNALSFLEKYGFKVIVLDENAIDKTLEEVKKSIADGDIEYIYTFEEDKLDERIDKFISSSGAKRTILNRLDSISDEQRENDENYVTITKNNLDAIKLEIYD